MLQSLRKVISYIFAYFMSINSVAVTYCEKVETKLVHHIRLEYVSILVSFVRIIGCESTTCSECKLCYNIKTVDILWWIKRVPYRLFRLLLQFIYKYAVLRSLIRWMSLGATVIGWSSRANRLGLLSCRYSTCWNLFIKNKCSLNLIL